MKISVITISYNQRTYLKECIDSVLEQRDNNYEHIIVDAGSNDGSRELIESYGSLIIKVFESDDGPADGLNKGFKYAHGEIFCYLNSDDKLAPNALSYIRSCFISAKIDIVLGAAYLIDSKSNITGRIYSTNWTPMGYVYGFSQAVQPSTFFRSSFFLLTDGFNRDNKTCWDLELLLDMRNTGAQIMITRKILSCFRLHQDSISGSERLQKQFFSDTNRLRKKILSRECKYRDYMIGIILRLAKFARYPWLLSAYINRHFFSTKDTKY